MIKLTFKHEKESIFDAILVNKTPLSRFVTQIAGSINLSFASIDIKDIMNAKSTIALCQNIENSDLDIQNKALVAVFCGMEICKNSDNVMASAYLAAKSIGNKSLSKIIENVYLQFQSKSWLIALIFLGCCLAIKNMDHSEIEGKIVYYKMKNEINKANPSFLDAGVFDVSNN